VRQDAPEDLAEALVQAALDGGADDNVTVVVAHVAAA
jgi:serine/threonine protein phosphatase PrpC